MKPRVGRLVLPILAAFLAIAFLLKGEFLESSAGNSRLLFAATFTFAVLYCCSFLLLVGERQIVFRIAEHSKILFLFLFYVLSSALWSQVPIKVLGNWLHHVGMTFVVMTAVVATLQSEKVVLRAILVGCTTVLVASLAVVALNPRYGIDPVSLTRWRGVTGHPNTLGGYALVAVWSATAMLYEKPNRWEVFLLILALLSAVVCLIGSNSMTSSAISIFILLTIPSWQKIVRPAVISSVLKFLLFFLPLTFCIFTTFLVAPEVFDVEHILSISGRDSTLTGRTAIWFSALQAHGVRPWLGWSFDSYLTLANTYGHEFRQFHNGYLDVLVRGGWLGLILITILLITLVYRCFRLLKSRTTLAVSLLTLLVAVLAHNFTESSLARDRSILWLLIIYSYLLTGVLCSTGGASYDRRL